MCYLNHLRRTSIKAKKNVIGLIVAVVILVLSGEINYLGVETLADSSVVLKFKADVEEQNIFTGRRVLNKELKCAFDKEKIEIAFPQLDVHTK